MIMFRRVYMPELPEVETVKETLKKVLIGRKICKVKVYYPRIIANTQICDFEKNLMNQTIHDLQRRGKFLLFELDNYFLLSHLRMEGKYLFRKEEEPILKHEHVVFDLDKDEQLRYQDTRKFGKMYLFEKEEVWKKKPLKELGKEPWDPKLTPDYLKDIFKNKKIPIKTALLDQSIIAGIGNIYADEILFLSQLNPFSRCCDLQKQDFKKIIQNTQEILKKAIVKGGTTIHSFESSEGVHGRFQQELFVHGMEVCKECKTDILKVFIGGRGTYYCPKCQKIRG